MGADVIGDSWYADYLPGVEPLDRALGRLPGPIGRVVASVGLLRGVALFVYGLRRPGIVATAVHPGVRLCILLCALANRRKVMLLEYIVHPPAGRGWGLEYLVRRIEFGVVRKWASRRAVRWVHVLAPDDLRNHPATHELPVDYFKLVMWPLRPTVELDFPPLTADRRVVASGRRSDWDTFFAAAADADWDITVVCAAKDRARLERLAKGCRRPVTILSEIDEHEHRDQLRGATVYVVPVRDTGTSIGQMRIKNANEAGVPVVASDVVGLRGYIDSSTGRLVPPADPAAMRAAVDELLDSPEERDRLRHAARAVGERTSEDYLAELAALMVPAELPGR